MTYSNKMSKLALHTTTKAITHHGNKMILLKDYKAPDFVIEQIDLHIELKEQDTLVRSKLVVKRNNSQAEDLCLDGEHQTLISIELEGTILDSSQYKLTDTQLIIFNIPDICTLSITTHIQPQNNTALSGLYRSNGLFCTQCEAQGFRRITYYLDRPDVMSVFTTTIVADAQRYPILLSNGNKIDSGSLEGGRHWVTWHDPFKKPAYLFALVAGNLHYIQDVYTTRSHRTIDLFIYFEPQHDKQQSVFAMDALKKAMLWDERTYDLEYDLDRYMIVAVNDFNMGAMENKGLNIFNAKYILAEQKISTDMDFHNILLVVGHEYFHNWTGNRVTLRDWFQLSLKEGLTVFREQQFMAAQGSAIVNRIHDVRFLRTQQFAEDSGPLAHPVQPASYFEIDNFYTTTVYNKGSEVVRMLQTIVGQPGFKKGIDLYFARHDGQAVTIEDFLAAIGDANNRDLSQFKRWYTQAGTPTLKVISQYNAQTQVLTLECSQNAVPTADGSLKEPFVIPIIVELLSQTGDVIMPNKTDKNILILNKISQNFVFDNIKSEPIVSLLGNFSAPVKLEYDYSDAQLAVLVAHDPDLFNRWNACVQLFTRLIKQPESSADVLIEALSSVLSDVITGQLQDTAFLSELLHFPSIAYLIEQLDGQHKINITALLAVRAQRIAQLVEALQEPLEAVYLAMQEQTPAKRALKNACLQLLGQSTNNHIEEKALHLAIEQYHNAQNMTDTIGALEVIKNNTDAIRDTLILDFYEAYQNYPLVVTKWFALQARAKVLNVVENIKALMQHKAFNILTPNHVYALIGEFANANPDYFHKGSAGYNLVADCIIQIDPKNPSVAAHLANSLLLWKRLAPMQSDFMKEAIEKIKAQPVISKNLSEIIVKALS